MKRSSRRRVSTALVLLLLLSSARLLSAQTSSAGTELPPASQVIDTQNAAWTISPSDLHILRNGEWAAGGLGSKIFWSGSQLYVFGTNDIWHLWTGSGWTALTGEHPVIDPLPPPPSTPLPEVVSDPTTLVFGPSSDHDAILPDGTPTVSGYAFSAFIAGTTQQAGQTVTLGKPTPVDGLIRVPLPLELSVARGVGYEGHLVAVGPTGTSASVVTNPFLFSPIVTPPTTPDDTTLPAVAITVLRRNGNSRNYTVTAKATDASGVVKVQFLLDGRIVNSQAQATPFTSDAFTAGFPLAAAGSHVLVVEATDAAGKIGQASQTFVR